MHKLDLKDLDKYVELDEHAAAHISGGKGRKLYRWTRGGQSSPLFDITGSFTRVFGEDGDYTKEAAEYILDNPGKVIPLF